LKKKKEEKGIAPSVLVKKVVQRKNLLGSGLRTVWQGKSVTRKNNKAVV
jgi:hypothetical protein